MTELVSFGLSESQFSVLKKSSRVNGKTIPLWRDPRLPSECVCIHFINIPPEVDEDRDRPDQPELAQAQLAQSATWKLPAELCPDWSHSSNDIQPQDIAQRVVSDCSVCASIVVCLAHHKRFSSKVRLLEPSGSRDLIKATARTIIPPSAPRHTLRRLVHTLPI